MTMTAAELRKILNENPKLTRERMALAFEKSVSAIRRILSRPDNFTFDLPNSLEVWPFAAALGKPTEAIRANWLKLEHRTEWKIGPYRNRQEIAKPFI
jgi:hypothetical protein